jgi:hypothetical protein
MTQFMELNTQDQAALAALAEFEISPDGKTATAAGTMEVDDSESPFPTTKNLTSGCYGPNFWSSSASEMAQTHHDQRRRERIAAALFVPSRRAKT